MSGTKPGRFLSARWCDLVLLNYEVDPALLKPRVPAGTQLDLWHGRCLVSMVGFRFLDTRVLGFDIPGHRDFEEVNLRFYVVRDVAGELRRGAVFVKEIVPRPAIAWVARTFYNEPYIALPMGHTVDRQATPPVVEYTWRDRGQTGRLGLEPAGTPAFPTPGSEAQFITEHYWGYTPQLDGSTLEYQVEHPPWQVQAAGRSWFQADVARLYGREFVPFLTGPPVSAFLAVGSEVTVRRGTTSYPAPRFDG
jgi:uncharacterized protein YqjF (DUF2071 family)